MSDNKCIACNGSGRYDHNGSPPCGACEGTGKALKEWTVQYKISGTAYALVKAATEEEARDAAWALYHNGDPSEDLEDLTWEVDDLDVETIK